jgi:beta-glucosidase-like glycosyl hydrolase
VAKCLAAYSLECALLDDPYRGCVGDAYLGDRHHFNAQVSERDLRETYLPAFKHISAAGAAGVMCAYNSINGVPACANNELIQSALREGFGFQGFIASDCGAVEQIYTGHNFTDSLAGAVVSAIRAGVDSTCGTEFTNTTSGVLAAIARGQLTMEDLDQMAGRVLLVRFKLGLFDAPDLVPFQRWSLLDSVDTPEHRALALRAAREAIVLLRNDDDGLPLERPLKKGRRVVVIGPQGNATRFTAGYSWGV